MSNPTADSPKILLTGSQGQVGWELRSTLAALGNVIALGHNELDLGDSDHILRTVRELRPQVVVNAAAYTAVDKAESEPGLAMKINAIAPGILAEEAKRIGATLVHYSTDYVFDGAKQRPYVEADAPNPINMYGKSKLEGERAIAAVGGSFFIFRTSWVYGPRGQNFLLTILRLAKSRDELRIVDDQYGAPTWSHTIAEVTAAVLRHNAGENHRGSGLLHLTSRGKTTWCGFAQLALHRLGLSTRIVPIAASEYRSAARRPANSLLATDKLRTNFDVILPSWEDSLDRVLVELRRPPLSGVAGA